MRQIPEWMKNDPLVELKPGRIPAQGETIDGIRFEKNYSVTLSDGCSFADQMHSEPAINMLTGRTSLGAADGYTHYCLVHKDDKTMEVICGKHHG